MRSMSNGSHLTRWQDLCAVVHIHKPVLEEDGLGTNLCLMLERWMAQYD